MESIILLIRSLIYDLESLEYSDEDLEKVACAAGLIILNEISFGDIVYTIDILNSSISPEPDNTFSIFCAYKSAILLIQSEIRKFSSKSVKITDGPSSIDLTNKAKDLKGLLDSLLSQYDKMKLDYAVSISTGSVFAVSTPTTAYLSYYKRFN